MPAIADTVRLLVAFQADTKEPSHSVNRPWRRASLAQLSVRSTTLFHSDSSVLLSKSVTPYPDEGMLTLRTKPDTRLRRIVLVVIEVEVITWSVRVASYSLN